MGDVAMKGWALEDGCKTGCRGYDNRWWFYCIGSTKTGPWQKM